MGSPHLRQANGCREAARHPSRWALPGLLLHLARLQSSAAGGGGRTPACTIAATRRTSTSSLHGPLRHPTAGSHARARSLPPCQAEQEAVEKGQPAPFPSCRRHTRLLSPVAPPLAPHRTMPTTRSSPRPSPGPHLCSADFSYPGSRHNTVSSAAHVSSSPQTIRNSSAMSACRRVDAR